ncbi:hypothetical protein BX616_004827 [Lobosporangium transversale]|uniref:Uncharacterized protein n=1 Tax=Lobosporangium transversale TaxID=64571 RepID=A0A1Y2GC77_9FUNG|nr:hypothetical protein BCR41DRAFT_399997 [Lobosporangium transversale]KAF9918875.1 hypothetical protein BX616_004827 [Lobosporangium transversale]ORZ06798.1 hypothetical protein BCR41DRAFT_399997 [Lobosporangium transversale]|eukprot:XP_021877719.1 hypothetical protein BCR41DRAFT_399997 [Lobosporangium transversale]
MRHSFECDGVKYLITLAVSLNETGHTSEPEFEVLCDEGITAGAVINWIIFTISWVPLALYFLLFILSGLYSMGKWLLLRIEDRYYESVEPWLQRRREAAKMKKKKKDDNNNRVAVGSYNLSLSIPMSLDDSASINSGTTVNEDIVLDMSHGNQHHSGAQTAAIPAITTIIINTAATATATATSTTAMRNLTFFGRFAQFFGRRHRRTSDPCASEGLQAVPEMRDIDSSAAYIDTPVTEGMKEGTATYLDIKS